MYKSLLPLLFGLVACSAQDDSQLNWGHSTDLDQAFRSSAYLFGIEPQTRLHACIENQPAGTDWLKAEIFTAVNVWAQAVGRSIPLSFDGCGEAPALRVVFAKAPVSGEFVGYTLYERERIVYLDPSREWRDVGEILGFNRQAELKAAGWETKARFLFPLVSEGSYSSFKLPIRSSKSPQSSLSTLMHELGHAWGLCDLYDERSKDAAFNRNCSPRYRSGGIALDEVMNAATNPGTARLRLSAADKEGIRALFARADFPQSRGWGKNLQPLEASDLLIKALGSVEEGNPSPTGAGELKGSVKKSLLGREVRLSFSIETPLSTSSVFLYEKLGRGPFLQLDEERSIVRGNRRMWQGELLLPAETELSELFYQANVPGLPGLELPLAD